MSDEAFRTARNLLALLAGFGGIAFIAACIEWARAAS